MLKPEDLEKLVAAQNFQAAAWIKVIDAGRQYAQMKAFGSYIENGSNVVVCHSDQASMLKMFQETVLRECERAFLEDALLGAEIQKVSK